MLARWRTTATNALPSVDEEGSCRKEDDASNAQIIITKLQQENQQLRRELNDAYHRIRDLEGSLAVLIVSSADDDDDGTSASVEVQSVASMTDHLSMSSSTTTIPTGSALANKMREQQQKREDLVTLKNHRKANRASRQRRSKVAPSSSVSRENAHKDPYGILMKTASANRDPLAGTTAATLNRESSSASDPSLDFLLNSSISESDEASAGMVGKMLVMPSDNVSAFTSGYFMRVDSTDDIDSFWEI